MKEIDIILPINLKPLTYLCPKELEDKAIIGMAVSVPLKKKTAYGVISEINNSNSNIIEDCTAAIKPKGSRPIKEIISLIGDSPILTKNHLEFISWLSGYYHCDNGLVLKAMIPDEILRGVQKNPNLSKWCGKRPPMPQSSHLDRLADEKSTIEQNQLQTLKKFINVQIYKTMLIHCDSIIHQLSLVTYMLNDVKNAIILCPEIETCEYTASIIEKALNRKVLIVHSGLSRGKRSWTYNKIIKGDTDPLNGLIVCGTLSASLIPIASPELLIVMDEHSQYYKQDRHPRFNARDIMVRRGFMENIPVVLLSSSPSCISYYNAEIGKYIFLDLTKQHKDIIIENMSGTKNIIKKDIFTILKKPPQKNSLLYINKKGYSFLRCIDCERIITCPNCKSPMMFFEDKTLNCSVCGFYIQTITNCPICKGAMFDNIGSGIQRIDRLINQKTGLVPVRIDSSLTKTLYQRAVKETLKNPFVIATKACLNEPAFLKHFDNIIYINTDINFSIPDYLSNERLYQEIIALCELLKDKGRIYIQTRFVDNPVFNTLKKRDLHSFVINEINKRSDLSYPPYSKMASLTFYYNGTVFPFEISETIDGVDILGPINVFFRHKGYSKSIRIILKSKDRRTLNQAIKYLKKSAENNKIYLDIDIDP